MRLWPFKWEIRQVDATTEALQKYGAFLASGSAEADVNRTAAVEFALGMTGRAFMMAEITPSSPALDPLTMAMLARQTLAYGNAVFRIQTGITRPLYLEPVGKYSIRGNVSPESWRYQIKQYAPRPDDESAEEDSNAVISNVPYAGMVHVRYMPKPEEPWHGVSPFVSAGATADQVAQIERSLGFDTNPATWYIVATPDGASQDTIDSAHTAFGNNKGMLTLLETTKAGFGQGATSAPKEDWKAVRIGPEVPGANVTMRDSSAEWLLDASGIPAALHRSDGAAQRESYRHLFTATIEPLGALIAAELSEKLERDIEIMFPQAFKSDMVARGRTLPNLIKAGVPAAAAGKLVGLPQDALPIEQEPEEDSDEGLPNSENGDTNIPNRHMTTPSSSNGRKPNARIHTPV